MKKKKTKKINCKMRAKKNLSIRISKGLKESTKTHFCLTLLNP
jgi:hypothetical protein